MSKNGLICPTGIFLINVMWNYHFYIVMVYYIHAQGQQMEISIVLYLYCKLSLF